MRVRDFATVERGAEPVFNLVTADGQEAVLLNIYSQPDGSTLDIASRLAAELKALKQELPPDMKLAFSTTSRFWCAPRLPASGKPSSSA